MATLDLPTTAAAAIERSKLQRHFGRLDILFFLICTIVGVDTVANVAQGGGQAFTWMMVFAVVFFVPQALLFSELGTAFPKEGGPYCWTRLAFGHLAGAVNNFLYWITNPVWIGGSLTISCIGAVQVFFNNGNTLPTVVWYIVDAGLRVGVDRRRDHVLQRRQVAAHGRRLRPLRAAGPVHPHGRAVRAKHGVHGLGASGYKPQQAASSCWSACCCSTSSGSSCPAAPARR